MKIALISPAGAMHRYNGMFHKGLHYAPITLALLAALVPAELNADVVISDEFTSQSVVMPYMFTLEAGQSITFTVFTTDIMNLTEDTIDLVITRK